MKSEFLLELMFSNKVEEPMLYVPGICNYYSAADEPDKIKGNYLARKNFKWDFYLYIYNSTLYF